MLVESNTNQHVVVAKTIHSNEKAGHLLSEFLSGNLLFSPLELVATLKLYPNIATMYQLSAGVSEGYTVEEHSLRVLDEFEKKFQNEKTEALLKNVGLSTADFSLFLALHDIGKGRAVIEEGHYNTPTRKKKELEYCCDVISQLGKELNISPEKIAIFCQLLASDNVGEILKQPYITRALSLDYAHQFVSEANQCHLETQAFIQLKVLFHQCDAGSYPALQSLFITGSDPVEYCKPYQLMLDFIIETTEILHLDPKKDPLFGFDDLIPYCKENSVFFGCKLSFIYNRDPFSFSIREVLELIKIRKRFKTEIGHENKNKSATYRQFSNFLKQLMELKLPFRIANLVKTAVRFDWAFKVTDDFKFLNKVFNTFNIREGLSPKLIKAEMIKGLITHTAVYEKQFKILEKIQVLHGSNSATLIMMKLTDSWILKNSGDLFSSGIVPMCGEIDDGGFAINGINRHCISTETIRSIERVKLYANGFQFRPDKTYRMTIKRIKYPYDDLFLLSSVKKRIENLLAWKEHEYQDFLYHMEGKFRYLHDRIDIMIEKHANLGFKSSLSRLRDLKKILSKEHDLSALENKYTFVEKHNLDPIVTVEWKRPLSDLFSPNKIGVLGIQLNQLLQWDDQKMLSQLSIDEVIIHAKLEEKRILDSIDEVIFSMSCDISEEEKTYLLAREPDQLTPPKRLLEIIPELIYHDFLLTTKKITYPALRSQFYLYLGGIFRWSELIYSILRCRVRPNKLMKYSKHFEKNIAFLEVKKSLIKEWYRSFYKLFENRKPKVTIPDELRSFITSPFPVIFGSTCIKSVPFGVLREEFNLDGDVPIGANGMDLMITDTKEHRKMIRNLLPEKLRDEVNIYVYSEIDVPIPLLHAPNQIKM